MTLLSKKAKIMEKNSQKAAWATIVFGSKESKISQAIRRAVKAGELKKLSSRLYTSNFKDSPETIIKSHIFEILGAFFPQAVLSHRTALEGGILRNDVVVLTYRYTRKIKLPGVTIRLVKGKGAELGDMPFMNNLYIASRERALLENLQSSRKRNEVTKVLPRQEIEEYLNKLCQTYGAEELNKIRDKAKILSKSLSLVKEFKILDQLIGALLGTKEHNVLQTSLGIARAQGNPYDPYRLKIFTQLASYLNVQPLQKIKTHSLSFEELNNLSFFESYFSNYIEGTKFEVDEAVNIIFKGKLIPNRSKDAHDILGTFRIVSNLDEMRKTPKTIDEFSDLLKSRHALLMSARKDMNPGEFKKFSNRVGNTVFVKPELVMGTLIKALELYLILEPGLKRALFMKFVISEIHPFADGNGRIARIMMNAELVSSDEWRIIIPTVYREDYILTLRRLSRESDPTPYVRAMSRVQAFTASIAYSSFDRCFAQFDKSNAFLDSSEGKLLFKER